MIGGPGGPGEPLDFDEERLIILDSMYGALMCFLEMHTSLDDHASENEAKKYWQVLVSDDKRWMETLFTHMCCRNVVSIIKAGRSYSGPTIKKEDGGKKHNI